MGALTEYYVDPAIAADSGTGTIGDPFGDLQYALNNVTRDAVNGDRFNIKAGTAEILTGTISLTTYGTPAFGAQLAFEGYTSVAGDGGIGEIDGNAGNFTAFNYPTHTSFKNLKIGNTGTAQVLGINQRGVGIGLEIYGSSGNGVGLNGSNDEIIGDCYIHDIGGYGVECGTRSIVYGCFFLDGATNKFTQAIRMNSFSVAIRNIISLNNASGYGIYDNQEIVMIMHNSVYNASAGTNYGISLHNNASPNTLVANNLVEGWSGAGGVGMYTLSDINAWFGNAVYNNTTAFTIEAAIIGNDNETLGASPFAKEGANTYANRFNYFAPANVGNVRGGAWPSGMAYDKGAVQRAAGGAAAGYFSASLG